MTNIFVGIVLQFTLMTKPVFLVLREYSSLILCLVILILNFIILKFSWWNKLNESYGEHLVKDTGNIKEKDTVLAAEN